MLDWFNGLGRGSGRVGSGGPDSASRHLRRGLTARQMWLRAAALFVLCLAVAWPRVYVDADVVLPGPWRWLGQALQLYFVSGFAAFCLGVFRGFSAGNTILIFRMWLAAMVFFSAIMLLGVHWDDNHPALYLNPVPPAP